MTFVKKLLTMLEERGLSKAQAEGIIDLAKVDERIPAMDNRWNEQVEGYPDQVISLLWMSVSDIALEWIDANCPKAWFRAMFVQ